MWPLVMYSNCFEIVSIVAFLVFQTRLILGMFACLCHGNTVILYHYSYTILYKVIVFTAPGFWILAINLL